MKKSIWDRMEEHETKRVDKQFKKHEGKTDLIKKREHDDFVKSGKIVDIPLSEILDDTTFQIRTEQVSDEHVSEMAESIKRFGQLLPAYARPKDGKYQLLAGFTRKRALKKAGIKAIVKEVNDDMALSVAEVENWVRNELTFIDQLNHIQKLAGRGMDVKTISERLGKAIRSIQQYLQIGEKPELVKLIHADKLNYKEATKIVRLPADQYRKVVEKLNAIKTSKVTEPSGKKKSEMPAVIINKAKNKIRINISGKFTEISKVISQLKEAIKDLEKEK